MTYPSLSWEDVVEGADLPPITYELNLLRLVAFVRATGLYDYIHFDGDYARSVGMRDAFMSTPHIGGLFARLLTDWSGPDADIRTLAIGMKAQCCPGDMLTVSGRIARKYVNDAGEHLVDIDTMNIGHALAESAVTATATLAMPSRENGPVKSAIAGVVKTGTPGAEMPEQARALIGQVRPVPQPPTPPLTAHEIHLWCEALEDWNPLYWDEDYAARSRYGGVIAPPPMGWFFGAGASVNLGIGVEKPGKAVPEPVAAGLTGQVLLRKLRAGMIAEVNPIALTGFPEAAVMLSREDVFLPVRPGDSLHNDFQLLDCSPLKRTRVGEGHFLTFAYLCRNQRDELVKTQTINIYQYRVG